jgi:hypothetical protein
MSTDFFSGHPCQPRSSALLLPNSTDHLFQASYGEVSSVTVFQELRIRAHLDPVVRRKLAAGPLEFLADFDLSFDEKRQIVSFLTAKP